MYDRLNTSGPFNGVIGRHAFPSRSSVLMWKESESWNYSQTRNYQLLEKQYENLSRTFLFLSLSFFFFFFFFFIHVTTARAFYFYKRTTNREAGSRSSAIIILIFACFDIDGDVIPDFCYG